jgi:hypothetical protein
LQQSTTDYAHDCVERIEAFNVEVFKVQCDEGEVDGEHHLNCEDIGALAETPDVFNGRTVFGDACRDCQ